MPLALPLMCCAMCGVFLFLFHAVHALHCRFEVEGDGFLYKQVRNMVGAALAVGNGRLSLNYIPEALASGVRPGVRPYTLAEAKGLCLATIYHPAFEAFEGRGEQAPLLYGGMSAAMRAEFAAHAVVL
jgi:hypothetical protein